ncbi:hypothetical protein AB0M48_30250 [Lentzea sp. NPDC051208]|uniref:hypothetical protein n=1 Tax=Lentzea sp. NPDC051208 TaxID=3154642 RepID=UPI00342A92E5
MALTQALASVLHHHLQVIDLADLGRIRLGLLDPFPHAVGDESTIRHLMALTKLSTKQPTSAHRTTVVPVSP